MPSSWTPTQPAATMINARSIRPRTSSNGRRALPGRVDGRGSSTISRVSPTQVTPATSAPTRESTPPSWTVIGAAAGDVVTAPITPATPTDSPIHDTGRNQPGRVGCTAGGAIVDQLRRPRRSAATAPAPTRSTPPTIHGQTGIPVSWLVGATAVAEAVAGAGAVGAAVGCPTGALTGAAVGAAAAGPGVVSVNASDPVTGWPSSETTRYPIWYWPAGPRGETPIDTVDPVRVGLPVW